MCLYVCPMTDGRPYPGCNASWGQLQHPRDPGKDNGWMCCKACHYDFNCQQKLVQDAILTNMGAGAPTQSFFCAAADAEKIFRPI